MIARTLRLLPLIVSLVSASALHAGGDVEITDLRCEYATNPLGIDVAEPRLSWRIESPEQGQKQTAYQVLVSSSQEGLAKDVGDLWDAGRVTSDQSQYVAYDGKPLLSMMECHWKVKAWDKDGKPSDWSNPAKWVMGYLKASDWKAKWIHAPAPRSTPTKKGELTVTKATYRTLDGSVAVDVTEIVKKELARKKPLVVRFKTLGGDPARNVVKELVVEYVRDGKPGVARANDFKTINLFGTQTAPGTTTLQFRKDFALEAAPSSAYVTVNSPAYFELYVNGKRIGRDVLSPAVSKLDKVTFSLTYDVSEHLKVGENCMGLWLGKGWAQSIVVRAQLDAVVNGKRLSIGTDTSWKTRASGRYKVGQWKWGDFGGELLDARKALPDWSRSGLDTAAWSSAAVAKDLDLGPARNQPCPPLKFGTSTEANGPSLFGRAHATRPSAGL